jgi:hypothetical protein|nr:hypothetical protein [Kofleriaceae bacterium]
MTTRWFTVGLAFVLALVVTTAAADRKFGRQVRFDGIHPIPKSEGGGICYIDGPHVHIYEANKLEYRVHDDDEVFVGDPVAYGWEGPKFAYKGPHPIHVDMIVASDAGPGGAPDTEYCYITGPHFHHFEPPPGPEFQLAGGAYFYVGEPPKAFVDARPAYVGIDAVYAPIVYTRPVIEVAAPVGWIGARAEFAGPGVVVATPGVVVQAPGIVVVPPSVHVGIGVHVGVGVGIGVGVGPVGHGPRHRGR